MCVLLIHVPLIKNQPSFKNLLVIVPMLTNSLPAVTFTHLPSPHLSPHLRPPVPSLPDPPIIGTSRNRRELRKWAEGGDGGGRVMGGCLASKLPPVT